MLTIAIPTYNRSMCLNELLKDILLQLQSVDKGFVRVLVSDNASNDGTMDVVKGFDEDFKSVGSELIYRRNDVNIGFSPNVDFAVRDSPDEFVLIMGDDDGLEYGALAHVQEILKRHPDIDVLFLREKAYLQDLSAPVSQGEVAGVEQEDVRVFLDGNDYIRARKGFPPALVSGYVVRRISWISAFEKMFNESICVHMLVAAQILLRGGVAAESMRFSVKYRVDQPSETWSKDYLYPFRFYLNELSACRIYMVYANAKVFRLLYRVPLRIILYYIVRQCVVRHPFHKEKFWAVYDDVLPSCTTIYTIFISVLRHMPSWAVRCMFGWYVRHREA